MTERDNGKTPRLSLSNCKINRLRTLVEFRGNPDKLAQHNLGGRVLKETLLQFLPIIQSDALKEIFKKIDQHLATEEYDCSRFYELVNKLYDTAEYINQIIERSACGISDMAKSASNLADWLLGIK
ncbi:MAG: hypothetical protein SFT81_04250 [Candidatus Caenarcaniphilales bacterium]|nr:hypothetical protein [Candidatus Caenarcaniphilales bacterium]